MTNHPREGSLTPAGGRPRPAGSIGDVALEAARRGGQRPFLTFYDDGTGERTELGHATLHNWVSKTANLLVDELDLEPGATLAVRLPTHWTTLVILLAAWRAGVQVALAGRGDGAEASGAGGTAVPPEDGAEAVGEDALDTAGEASRTLVVGAGLGGRLLGDAGGALAYAEEVLACPDDFDDPPVESSAPALAAGGRGASHGDLLDAAAAAAEALDLAAGGRLLTTLPLDTAAGIVTLLAALATGTSVVLVAAADPAAQWPRAASERCDLVVTGDGPATLPRPPDGAPRWRRLALDWDGDRPAGVRTA